MMETTTIELDICEPDGSRRRITLSEDETVIGRSSGSGLRLADEALSRRHATLRRKQEEWIIEDLGSRHGTYVNHQRIKSTATLAVSDRIQMANCVLDVIRFGSGGGSDGVVALDQTKAQGDDQTLLFSAAELLMADEQPIGTTRMMDPTVRRLEMLNDLHELLTPLGDEFGVLDMVLANACQQLGNARGSVLRPIAGALGEDGVPEVEVVARRFDDGALETVTSKKLLRHVLVDGHAALVKDLGQDHRFAGSDSMIAAGLQSLIAAPVQAEGEIIAMFALSSSEARSFEREDVRLLVSLAAMAGMKINNLRLAVEAGERRALEREIQLARRIQQKLLPDSVPSIAGWEIAASSEPCKGVSGDLFTFTATDEGRIRLLLADVSGKGIAAAILTATLEALSAEPLQRGDAPAMLMAELASRLATRTPIEKYATAFLADIDPETGDMIFASGGHNTTILISDDGTIESLCSTGPPVGLMPGLPYSEERTTMPPGSTLIVYSDGITEAANAEGDEFELEGLEGSCRENCGCDAATMHTAILAATDAFAAGEPANDDRTLVIIRRLPS